MASVRLVRGLVVDGGIMWRQHDRDITRRELFLIDDITSQRAGDARRSGSVRIFMHQLRLHLPGDTLLVILASTFDPT